MPNISTVYSRKRIKVFAKYEIFDVLLLLIDSRFINVQLVTYFLFKLQVTNIVIASLKLLVKARINCL